MKTLSLWKFMLVTGKPAEMANVEKLAAGTHFLTAYGNKRGKRKAVSPRATFKRDCQRWGECMTNNPMQQIAGCGSGEDVCDGYLAQQEASHETMPER